MEVFDADPKSVYDLFLSRGTAGYYIPAYQREYSWDAKDHVFRFIEDICIGLNTYIEHSDSITFIGSIISIRDTENKTIKPYVQGHLPSEVMTVIDGQQRVTTMSLLGIVLHNMICEKINKIEKKHNDSIISSWFMNQCGPILNSLTHTFELDVYGTDENYRFYPKIIRSYVDQWAKEEQLACYNSPIARFQFEYIKYILSSENSRPSKIIKYEISEISENEKTKHKKVFDNVKFLFDALSKASKSKHSHFILPNLSTEILGDSELERRFFKENIPEDIKNIINEDELIFSSLSLVMLANYFLHRVAVTAVVAKNESYAFDMFEALNTTGEPLTAFETFKPKVIDAEGISEYEGSESYKYINIVNQSLESYTKAEEKQKATTRLLIPFRLLYEGEKLSKHLSAQRRFLSKAFDDCDNKNKKRRFIKNMSELSIFMKKMWPEKSGRLPSFDEYNLEDKEEVLLAITVLREANHNITVPILARYYTYSSFEKFSKESLIQFSQAVKAVLAFFILWRSSRSNTAGIEEYYREIMKDGYSYKEDNHNIEVIKPLSIKKSDEKPPDASKLKEAFLAILANKSGEKSNKSPIVSKEDWVKKVVVQPLYSINKPLVRILILLSSHDTVADKDNPGIIKNATINFNNMLNTHSWLEHSTIEHIWPKNAADDDWDSSLDELSSDDILGNLTLLPRSENSCAGARSWKNKQIIYKILSADTNEERDKLLQIAREEDIQISSSTEELLLHSRHLPQIKSISSIDGSFTKEAVSMRGSNIADIVWDKVITWLQ